MKKVLLIFGTRPEAIKMAPIIKELKAHPSAFVARVCVTAQHREMLAQVLSIFNIVSDYDLDIMTENQDLFEVTTRSLNGLKDVLSKESPDIVLVQGDTTTSFAASLGAYYLQIPVGHVEAGLRTFNKYIPFPEEKNRHLTGVLADYHFAPTQWAKDNLLKENVCEERIWVTGNTVVDALLTVVKNQQSFARQKELYNYFKEKWNIKLPTGPDNNKLILVTGHRRESFGEGFKNICLALKEIAEKSTNVTIVYPVHFNPNVQQPVRAILNGRPHIHLIEPLDYEPFVHLMSKSYLILTDSGGIQEEAPLLGKPVLVMRNTTERPEGIEAGTAKLVGTDPAMIFSQTMKLLKDKKSYESMAKALNPYGDGNAGRRICQILERVVGNNKAKGDD
ncbi:MAG: UDP-N-acetylglucosamine 2-epimerase (non-hydrolyzing) [Candidatus Aenigmarchaeota archaeon]|nr:UDP-N-acetylglucosamine 2-epimerase (non-hydrolyzing) [Candidatus Aenigmarchaeota archaeon]